MAVPEPPGGFARFIMKSKFGMGRDFQILDPETEQQLFFVDGKVGPRPACDVLNQDGSVIATVTGKLLGIPKRMDVADAEGQHLAHLHAPPITFLKDKVKVTLASGEELDLVGNIIEKDYAVRDSQGTLRIQITEKWVTIRDSYTIDVADDTPPELAFALAWAIDRWVEQD